MMSNFYFPWQVPYSQPALPQFWQNYWIYSQLWQGNQLSYQTFSPNSFLETSLNQKRQEKNCEEQIMEMKKLMPASDSDQVSVNEIDGENGKQEMDDARTRQKYGRNITSNIFRSLLKRISSPNRFKKLFYEIAQQKKLAISYDKFLEQIDRLSYKLRSYVKRNEMRRFIMPESQQSTREEFCLMFRIMAKIYLKYEHTTSIFYSKKINKQSRRLHFVLVREMESLLK